MFDVLQRKFPFPDGHILWTLREDYHSKHSDYGLMEENLSALERSGGCQVIKMGERFRDPHSGLTGLLYVVVKRADPEEEFVAPPDTVPEEALLPSIVVDTVRAGLPTLAGGGSAAELAAMGQHGQATAGGGVGGLGVGASAVPQRGQEYYEMGEKVGSRKRRRISEINLILCQGQ